jgi:hypothetical protein
VFSIAPHFYPICFGKYFPPFPCISGPKEKNFKILQNIITKIWGDSIVLEVFGDGPIKPASCQKKEKTWDAPHLINAKHNIPQCTTQ